jgi:hypothetical protein
MRTITLVIVPGCGRRSVSIATGTSLAALATSQNLLDREFSIRGVQIPRNQWTTTYLDDVTEVFATGAVKGA